MSTIHVSFSPPSDDQVNQKIDLYVISDSTIRVVSDPEGFIKVINSETSEGNIRFDIDPQKGLNVKNQNLYLKDVLTPDITTLILDLRSPNYRFVTFKVKSNELDITPYSVQRNLNGNGWTIQTNRTVPENSSFYYQLLSNYLLQVPETKMEIEISVDARIQEIDQQIAKLTQERERLIKSKGIAPYERDDERVYQRLGPRILSESTTETPSYNMGRNPNTEALYKRMGPAPDTKQLYLTPAEIKALSDTYVKDSIYSKIGPKVREEYSNMKSRIKGILFDFDNTLMGVHVYSQYCRNSADFLRGAYDSQLISFLAEGTREKFAEFQVLCVRKGIALAIGSYGNADCIEYLCQRLLPVFTRKRIYTPSRFSSEKVGDLFVPYMGINSETRIPDGTDMGDGKVSMLTQFARDINTTIDQTMLVDDDDKNVRATVAAGAIQMPIRIPVRSTGLTVENFDELIKFVTEI